jgi:hypothetical protein
MFLEILFRRGSGYAWKHTNRGLDDYGIRIQVSHCWQEGPEDLHVHFNDDECGYCPVWCPHTGDHVVPGPGGKGLVRAYSFHFLTQSCARLPMAGKVYVQKLKEVWPSPNAERWKGRRRVMSFLNKLAETVKKEK